MQVGIKCFHRGNMSFQECSDCSISLDHPCEMPTQVIQIILRDSVTRHAPGTFSVTGLLGCARKDILKGDYRYYEDMEGNWKKLRGSMVHALLEKEGMDYPNSLLTLREVRFTTAIDTTYGPQKFSGQPDEVVIFSVDQGVAKVGIWDWKTTSEIKHEMSTAYDDNRKQINMYKYLITKALSYYITGEISNGRLPVDFPYINAVEVIYCELFYGDMKKTRRFSNLGALTTKGKMTKRTHPQEWDTLVLAPIETRSLERTERYIIERIEQKLGAHLVLPPILEGDAAKFCPYCSVREVCYQKWKEEENEKH